VGPSHDTQERRVEEEIPIDTVGAGRYLNFKVLGRYPLGPAGSIELGVERRDHAITDLSELVLDPERKFLFERSLTARRLDAAAGWRHRWRGLEAAATVRFVQPSGRSENEDTLYQSHGSLWGAAAEARWRAGPWTVALAAERVSGTLEVDERSTPAGVDRVVPGSAVLASLRPSVAFRWSCTELFGAVGFERQNLPFVALGVLSAEAAALQAGRHLDSALDEVFWDLRVRQTFTPQLSASLGVRLGYGLETVTISDAGGTVVDRLDLRRRGIFGGGLSGQLGSPEFTVFLGANFALGRASH
jgi:hypothetical protein